jgi:TP901 family phage tail tape measure protein
MAGVAMKAGFAIAAGGVANLLVGLGILGGAFALAGAAGNFEQQMSLVGQLADASGERLERLRSAAIEAGLATRFSPDEAVEGLRNLITAGLHAELAAEALTPALQVATFGMIEVADAGAAIVGSMNAFRRQGLGAQQIADRLATAMARTNFQATDFAVGLSMVSGTAGLFNQTLDTTLVGMGLLRNMNLGASTSATALREAIRRLGSDQRAQAEASRLIGIEGIFSENGQGEMRNIIDIMADLDTAMQDLTVVQRQQHLATILGARGLNFFAAVSGAEFRQTLADGTTQILRGVDAARELERQMASSAGMADRLQRAVSEGNYAGVVTVLQGVGQTLLIEFGRPIGEVLVPILVVFRDVLTAITRFTSQLPNPLKRAGAAIMLLSGLLFTGSGIAGLFVAALILIIPVLDTILIAIGVLAAAMLPFIAAVGATGAAIVGFVQLVRLNVGGIADFFTRIWSKVRLIFNGITQLFSRGGFSGAVREEMNGAENGGIRQFAISIFRIGSRIMQFFRAIQTGFSAAARAMGPRVQGMLRSFRELFEALGFVSAGVSGLADTDMNAWAEGGARVGAILADVLGYIVDGIRRTTMVATHMIKFFGEGWAQLAPFFEILGGQISMLATEFQALFTELNVHTGDNAQGMMSLGEVAAFVLRGIVGSIVSVVTAMVWLTRQIVAVMRFFTSAGATIGDGFAIMSIRVRTVFANMVDHIRNALDQILVFIGQLIGRIPAGFRPQGLDDVVRSGMEAETRINQRNENIAARTAAGRREEATRGISRTRAFEAISQVQGQARDRQMEAVVRALETERARDRAEAQRPIEVHIDGERVASAVAGANRREGARGFVPVPTDG